jgi:hypothetical protein
VPFIRGRLVIMGDADCTYDFRNLKPFYDAYRSGATFIMGSRFKGTIEKGAMPFHHRYLGTPITTWVLNRLFKSKFSDIHCGMRAVTTDFLRRMNLQSQSWEYASEMVIKSVTMEAKIAEVPVTFYRDRNGRESHHKRQGWTSPYRAAWSNLQAMFTYGLDFFMIKPGLAFSLIGVVLVYSQLFGVSTIGAVTFSTFWQLFGAFIQSIGVSLLLLGLNVRNLFRPQPSPRWDRWFALTVNKASVILLITFAIGLSGLIPLVESYLESGLELSTSTSSERIRAIAALSLMATGFMVFVNSLVHRALIAWMLSSQNDYLMGQRSDESSTMIYRDKN